MKRLLIGPVNTVGQASAWANVVSGQLGVPTAIWKSADPSEGSPYRTDRFIPQRDFPTREAQRALIDEIARNFTHVIDESGQPFGGAVSMGRCILDAYRMRLKGVRTAFLFHGSDIRQPSVHSTAQEDSPFHGPLEGLTEKLEQRVAAQRARLRFWFGTTFVSTIDLQAYVPRSTWLPVVIDAQWFAPFPPIDTTRARPRVLHMWTRRDFSQSDAIDATCTTLHDSGIIEYRSVANVPPSEVRDYVAWSDIVIDKVGFGVTGVFAAEAAAAGRLVIGDVGARTRATLPDHPVIDASTQTLDRVIRALLSDRTTWPSRVAAGQQFAREYHDGHLSAQVLATWLGVRAVQR